MSETYLTADGTALALHQAGSGRAAVFQHGLCGDAGQPAQVFPADAGFACVTLECRGHGGSQIGTADSLSIATFADDLASMITARGLGPCPVGGISMGAAIALRLAVTRPDLVSALVLARPAWITGPAPANLAPNALVGALMRSHPPEAARALFEASDTAAELAASAPDNLASLRGFFARQPAAGTAELLARIAADGPGVTKDDLAGLKVPTLVIGTKLDFIHPMSHASALNLMIPQSSLAQITPKGEDPAAYRTDFRTALATFLKGL